MSSTSHGNRITDEQRWSWVDRDAPELRAHLERHPGDAERVRRLRELIAGLGEVGGAPPTDAPSALPSDVPGFTVIRRVGQGGMGVVFEAEQAEPRRRVALKFLRAGALADEALDRRLRREAQALARLQHPDIATIHGAGRSDGGLSYLVMELVDGRSLDLWVRSERPSRRRRLELVVAIAEAVDHAHAHGVVHRDLKPSNVLVTARGRPKVLDFGLARLADEPGASLPVTATADVLGTLSYMSPEQIRGDGKAVGVRSDVYALGVVLYELVAGRLPHDLTGTSLPAAARIKCETPPRRLPWSERGDLETVILRALEIEPRRRYGSAAAFADDVRRAMEGRPVAARRPSLAYRGRRFVGRHKLGVAFLVLVVAALLFPFTGITRELSFADGFPRVSPFTSLRWQGDVPIVQVAGDDRRYELLELDGLRAGLIVESIKQSVDGDWRKRFAEDLWERLFLMWHWPGFSADLLLRDVETGRVVARDDVVMTTDNRGALMEARWRRPFHGSRLAEGALQVRLEADGPWYELVALEGVPGDDVARAITRESLDAGASVTPFAEFTDRWVLLTGESPPDVMTATVRGADGELVRREVSLEDPTAGRGFFWVDPEEARVPVR